MTRATDQELSLFLEIRRARRERDAKTLIAALGSEVSGSIAAEYLGQVGDPADLEAQRALVPLLRSEDADRRFGAAFALGRLDATPAASELTRLVGDDPDAGVRAGALEALSLLTKWDATDVALSALCDPNWRVRRVAVESLRDAERADVIGPLRQAMRRERWYARGIYFRAIRHRPRSRRGERRLRRRARHLNKEGNVHSELTRRWELAIFAAIAVTTALAGIVLPPGTALAVVGVTLGGAVIAAATWARRALARRK